ncbi:MAG: hypothetical protein KDC12_05340 [Flavobacteriales bacterium]|nr:hypothetical protein [Flavobacteriales bacterium]
MKQWIIGAVALFGAGSMWGQTGALVQLSEDSIAIGEQITVQLSVTYPASTGSVVWPQLGDTLTREIEILEAGKIDTVLAQVDVAGDYFTQTQSLTVTSFESGYFVIRPLVFRVDSGEVLTPAALLTVSEPQIGDEQEFKDIKDIRDIRYGLTDFLKQYGLWIVLGLAAIAIAVWLIKRVKSRKNMHPEAEVQQAPKIVEPAHVIAERELKQLKADAVWQSGNYKGYYSRLTDIFRRYLENRFRVQAMEETSAQIMSDLRSLGLEQLLVNRAGEMLRLADLAKFAKSRPTPEDNENAMRAVEDFVRQTQVTDSHE